jgi:hypothetical protein
MPGESAFKAEIDPRLVRRAAEMAGVSQSLLSNLLALASEYSARVRRDGFSTALEELIDSEPSAEN